MREKFYYSELFKKIANEQKMMLNNGTVKHGATYVQSLVILYLLDQEDRFGPEHEVSQKDVEQYLLLKGSTITPILNRMEENQLIIREKGRKDSRVKSLSVTEDGRAVAVVFFEVLSNVEKKMTSGMSEDEQVLLKTLLQRVMSNLSNEGD